MEDSLRDHLKTEYQAASSGYDSRDQLAGHEFIQVVLIGAGLLVVLAYMGLLPGNGTEAESTQVLSDGAAALLVGVGAIGYFALQAVTLDLASTHSAKGACRQRMEEIERAFRNDTSISAWDLWVKTVPDRHRHWVERLLKPKEGDPVVRLKRDAEHREIEGTMFVNTAEAICIGWPLVVGLVLVSLALQWHALALFALLVIGLTVHRVMASKAA